MFARAACAAADFWAIHTKDTDAFGTDAECVAAMHRPSAWPYSVLGNLPPVIYAKLDVPAMQRDGASELFGAPCAVPLHYRAHQAQIFKGLCSQQDERRGSGQPVKRICTLWKRQ